MCGDCKICVEISGSSNPMTFVLKEQCHGNSLFRDDLNLNKYSVMVTLNACNLHRRYIRSHCFFGWPIKSLSSLGWIDTIRTIEGMDVRTTTPNHGAKTKWCETFMRLWKSVIKHSNYASLTWNDHL